MKGMHISTSRRITIVWFRQDLRLADNPALLFASNMGEIVPLYILDTINPGEWAMGGASCVWLHHALGSLNQSLHSKLNLYRGDPLTILTNVVKQTKAQAVFWNRCYEPWSISRDQKIKTTLEENKLDVRSFNGSLLWEPWDVLKKDGTPYKVFTPYYRRGCSSKSEPREPLPKPDNLKIQNKCKSSLTVEALELLPEINWHIKLEDCWKITESAAHDRLDKFLIDDLENYVEGRNFPCRANVSKLSPYLHFGQISVNTVWYRAISAAGMIKNEVSLDTFLSELAWREFSYYLLYHFPQLPRGNLQSRFDRFSWNLNAGRELKAWQQGQTGYPLVDAGMRELYGTGFMHNRVRMITASFLVKNLMIHWHCGEDWFWDCLVDADLAANSASWQWVAGCGADAAPFFRIFNPITQSQKFDKHGEYIRQHVPELAKVPDKYIHAPWLAPGDVLNSFDLVIGNNYPAPIVDLKESRDRALAAFKLTKTFDV